MRREPTPPSRSRRYDEPVPPGSSERDSYHHGDLRRALVERGTELVAESGAEGFTLRELARRVGVNHRAVYRHFASKDDLLAAIAERGYEALVERFHADLAALADATAVDRLLGLAQAYVAFAFAEPAAFSVMFGRRLNEDGRYPSLEVPIRAAAAILTEVIEDGQRRDEIVAGSVRDLGLAFWASMHGIASMVLERRIRVKPSLRKGYVATLMAPLLRGLVR